MRLSDYVKYAVICVGNYYAQSSRVFNARGQRVYDALSGLTGLFLLVITLTYAGLRAHKVYTQLPATYRTTQSPAKIPYDFLNQLIPYSTPDPTYEFPSITMCADDPAASISLATCGKVTSAAVFGCDVNGTVYGTFIIYILFRYQSFFRTI